MILMMSPMVLPTILMFTIALVNQHASRPFCLIFLPAPNLLLARTPAPPLQSVRHSLCYVGEFRKIYAGAFQLIPLDFESKHWQQNELDFNRISPTNHLNG